MVRAPLKGRAFQHSQLFPLTCFEVSPERERSVSYILGVKTLGSVVKSEDDAMI